MKSILVLTISIFGLSLFAQNRPNSTPKARKGPRIAKVQKNRIIKEFPVETNHQGQKVSYLHYIDDSKNISEITVYEEHFAATLAYLYQQDYNQQWLDYLYEGLFLASSEIESLIMDGAENIPTESEFLKNYLNKDRKQPVNFKYEGNLSGIIGSVQDEAVLSIEEAASKSE